MDQWKAFSRFTAVVACSTILEFLGDLQMPCNAFYSSNHVVNNTLVVNHNNIVVNYEFNGFTMAGMNMHVPPPKHRAVSWRFILYHIYIYI